jgi:hypothetical protein
LLIWPWPWQIERHYRRWYFFNPRRSVFFFEM